VVLPVHRVRDVRDAATATAHVHGPWVHHGSVPRVVHLPEAHRHVTGTVPTGCVRTAAAKW
jgi:hypothetical protein